MTDRVVKRYMLFAGLSYYPGGGAQDLVGSYDDLCDAIIDGREEMAESGSQVDEPWFHVFDLWLNEIVAHEHRPYRRAEGK